MKVRPQSSFFFKLGNRRPTWSKTYAKIESSFGDKASMSWYSESKTSNALRLKGSALIIHTGQNYWMLIGQWREYFFS